MTTPIELDERFKVTPKMVKEMEILRSNGHTFRKIAQMFSIHPATVHYWTDDVYRGKMRKKNAMRRCGGRKRMDAKLKQDEKFTWEYAVGYIAKMVYRAKYKKKQESILGMPWQYWDTYLKHEWKRGQIKIK